MVTNAEQFRQNKSRINYNVKSKQFVKEKIVKNIVKPTNVKQWLNGIVFICPQYSSCLLAVVSVGWLGILIFCWYYDNDVWYMVTIIRLIC